MSKDQVEYLKHIQDESIYLHSLMEKGLTLNQFLEDDTLKRAVVRSLEIIGEATKKIPADFKVSWCRVRCKDMAGMRDRLIHNYMGVNCSIEWDVLKNKIPEFHKQILEVLETL